MELKKAPISPAAMAVIVRKGKFQRNSVCMWFWVEKSGKLSNPMEALPLKRAKVRTAMAVHRKHRHVTFRDQKLLASSQLNITPPAV